MIIKFSDNFESIFYAVLYSNLTDYILISKNEPDQLLKFETFIDIDNLNWPELLLQHNNRYGEIKWLNSDNQLLTQLKTDIEFSLRSWKLYKYRLVVQIIRQILKYGFNMVMKNYTNEYKILLNFNKQIENEITLSFGQLSILPFNCYNEKFLLINYNEENLIGDIIMAKLQNKYFHYNLILITQKKIYIYYQQRNFELVSSVINFQLNMNNFQQFWQEIVPNFLFNKSKQVLI